MFRYVDVLAGFGGYSAGQTNISHVIVAPAPAKCEKALEIAPKMCPRSAKRPPNDPQLPCALEIAPKMPPANCEMGNSGADPDARCEIGGEIPGGNFGAKPRNAKCLFVPQSIGP